MAASKNYNRNCMELHWYTAICAVNQTICSTLLPCQLQLSTGAAVKTPGLKDRGSGPPIRLQREYVQKPYGKTWDLLFYVSSQNGLKNHVFFCAIFAQNLCKLNVIRTQSERNLNAIRTLFVFLHPQYGYSRPSTGPPKVVKSAEKD